MEEKVTPVNGPKGWALKKVFIDETGKVFRKGIYCPNDTPESVQNETPVQKEVPQEVKEAKPSSNTDKELITLIAEVLKSMKEDNIEQKKLFVETLKAFAQGKSEPKGIGTEIAEAIKQANSKDAFKRTERRLDEIDQEDVLDPPVVFSAHSNGYLVYNYYGKNGETVLPPYGGVFRFERAGGKKIKTDREEQMLSFCTIAIHSKKEEAHLEGHPHFGLAFFKNSQSPLTVNNTVVQQAAQMWTKISQWDKSQVLNIAKTRPDLKDHIGMPIDKLRTALAVSFANEIMKEQEQSAMNRAKEGQIESLIPVVTK